QQTARRAADLPAVDPMPEPYHAVAPSLGLPELTLQLLAYDENDPSQQFAFINGARYMAGDTLPGDIRVIAINRRGAVLLARGRQLQLEARWRPCRERDPNERRRDFSAAAPCPCAAGRARTRRARGTRRR